MAKSYLIDTTKCVGCRSCQVSCKQWNDLPAEQTKLQTNNLGLQNPVTLSSKTLTVVTYKEVADTKAPGGLKYVFAKRQCMHCEEPACASACPSTAMRKSKQGPVTYDASKCIGCRYCMLACPFGAPTAQWDTLAPKIRKCTMCSDRVAAGSSPACAKACPAGAITWGERDQLLALAQKRIKDSPHKYVDHIYGEHEAGGTGVLYLSSVPFEQLGMTGVANHSYVQASALALEAVPPAVIGVGATLGALALVVHKRKQEIAKQGASVAEQEAFARPMRPAAAQAKLPARREAADAQREPVSFAPLQRDLWTPFNKVLLAVMMVGALSFLLRFALGLGGSTNLSDTHAWGLWIVFDLVWIAIAAGAFATAGLIYLFGQKHLYPLGRSAVLMGLLSYSFVTVTLIADLGLPWHAWQLLIAAPKHSAMYEVTWCITLYLSILLCEFLPIPFERWGFQRGMELWRKYSSAYVVAAMTGFVYLLSRNLLWSLMTFVVFTALAIKFRQREGEKPVPVMLALAAVVLSTMHQSSLGSIFLLMPDKLSALWWTPMLPINFFLSAVAAGTALIILMEMAIARGYRRPLPMRQLASMGQISFWALLAFEVIRLADLYNRGVLAAVASGPKGRLFLAEFVVGGVLPLLLLANAKLRQQSTWLALGALLTAGGVVLNRINVVTLAMDLKGPMPQIAPASYSPHAIEWGVSAGLCAAAIFAFGLVARVLPVLPQEEASGD